MDDVTRYVTLRGAGRRLRELLWERIDSVIDAASQSGPPSGE